MLQKEGEEQEKEKENEKGMIGQGTTNKKRKKQ